MQVIRNRRTVTRSRSLTLGLTGRQLRLAGATATVLTVAGGGFAYANTTVFGDHQVGSQSSKGIQISDDQVIKPIGDRLLTTDGKYMGSTVSPDKRFVAATSTDKNVVLQIVDLSTYKVIWRVGKAAGVDQKLSDGTVGQEGPTYSPDGKFLWLPQKDGLTRFPVNADGTLGTPTSVPLAKVGTKSALPGKATYSADGSTLYVPVNGQNTVVALDPATGAVQKTWAVGIAPREIALAGGKLYVSNEGGRTARPGDTTINSYGTDVPANATLGTSTTGTVSVIDPSKPTAAVGSIAVGLHPTALLARGNALFVANTNSDTVSVIDTTKDRVVQTIDTQPGPSSKVGYEPTSVALTADGHLLVTLGRANAVAVYRYGGTPQEPVSSIGLLPTDYFPATIATVGSQILVTNTRGIDARGPAVTITEGPGTTSATDHGTHSTTGSFTRFTLPKDKQIARDTRVVFAQNGWNKNDVQEAQGSTRKAVAVPRRIGDPSTIKHVFLLVKENRTYDQVYGDDTRGNGDASLAQFGKTVTPNQHALARQFGLYDNLYDIGTNSAEGHNWLMQGDNPEYTESSAGEYERSYDTEDDVLGHQRSGFLWTSVQAAGKTARNYGEFTQFETKPAGATWQKYYCASKTVDNGGSPSVLTDPAIKQDTESPIPSLNKITDHDYPKFDTDIPDQYRYQIWKQEFEKKGPANLNTFWLSSDHTGGTPDPRAQVADGDLAVGRIVDEISHSKYWKDSAIFVVEDDSQNGTDHVDGHRAPVQVISPWSLHGKVDDTYYSQLSVGRTIQQILGAQPLNQKLAAATPMYDAFTNKPNYKPFTAVPNEVPLTEGVTTAPACGDDTLGRKGAAVMQLTKQEAAATAVPAAERAVAAQWQTWRGQQRFTGDSAIPDYADPEQMNRYTWYQTHGWKTPYPGDSKIYAPSQVPGAYIPNADQE
ncbi:bifunctional YncE family protein/alkaline phosphatase family protein [Allobranchiibius sp. GilTou38]|uniref:bifunctional YncE family protein/alkaline phosphatase family protein n=1 Tax=Allobranchiibius sp. GilTou38 TaxID=2815210 RepID=UPI001AA18208|nr:bifunctional YncE family protein/alkaline phosphatase family protein [Allobranchiibius sp. GilTou38]MBO1767373.1 bifunctional YncE family protein/alkaline phosphatase family protein [Allobranchiibius sp. GilTou38]